MRDGVMGGRLSSGQCWLGMSGRSSARCSRSGSCQNWAQSGQIPIIPKPELRGFWGDSLTKPPFGVTSAEVAIICPEQCIYRTNFNQLPGVNEISLQKSMGRTVYLPTNLS